jgi:hypothetical protein
MLRTHTEDTSEKRTLENTDHDDILNILIKGERSEVARLVQSLAEKNNSTILSIIKVESFFKEHIEFDSRSQLLRELKGSMKATALNTIIARLVSENKLVVNDDRSLTWIDTAGNEKLNKVFEKAVPL